MGGQNRLPDAAAYERTLLNAIFLTEIQDVRQYSETTKWSDILFHTSYFSCLSLELQQPFSASLQLLSQFLHDNRYTILHRNAPTSFGHRNENHPPVMHYTNIPALKKLTAAATERQMPSTKLYGAMWQRDAVLKATSISISWYNCSLDTINSVQQRP